MKLPIPLPAIETIDIDKFADEIVIAHFKSSGKNHLDLGLAAAFDIATLSMLSALLAEIMRLTNEVSVLNSRIKTVKS
jgi:hypothetical protein